MPQAALAVAAWVGQTAFQIATAYGATVTTAATIANVAAAAAVVAEVVAVNAAVSAVTPKIKDPGLALQWQANPRAGVPYAIGRCAVAGNIIFNQSAPADSRKFLNFVTVYSGVPADAFEAYQANGVTVPFTADGGEGASGYYLNRMWLKSQLGHEAANWLHWTATGSKDTPANHGGMPTEWTSAHKTSGYAASLLAMEYDTKRFASGVPTPRMVGRWAKTYDPRQDDTYPGGEGLHRWNNEATWTWSKCVYRNALTWAIGRRNNGQLVLGMGYDIDEIDVAAFVHGMNVADANAWTSGGLVDSDDDPWEVLKAILQAGAGYPILGGTQLSVFVNAPAVSVATITEGDLIGAATIPAQVPADDRINTVWPSYTEEALDWQVVTPDAPVQVAGYVTVDGEERSLPLGMPLVQDATQAGQLSRYAIEDARELTGIVLPCKPWTQWIAPGLCVTANIPSAGLNGQKLRIQKRKRDPMSMTVTFISRTETDGKHAFALGQTTTPPDTPALSGGGSLIVPLPANDAFAVVGDSIGGAGGTLPAIVIAGEVDLYDAASIVVDYRQVIVPGEEWGDWQSASFPPSATVLVVGGVKPGATYQVRVRYLTVAGLEDPGTGTPLDDVTVAPVDSSTTGGKTPGDIVTDASDLLGPAIAAADAKATDALNALFDPSSGALHQITVLQAQDAVFTADIAVLNAADVTAAGRITTVETKQRSLPNLIRNGNAADPVALHYWTATAGYSVGTHVSLGTFFAAAANASGVTRTLTSDVHGTAPGEVLSLSLNGDPGSSTGAARATVYFVWLRNGTVLGNSASVTLDSTTLNWSDKRAPLQGVTVPATVAGQVPNGFQVVHATPNGHAGSNFSLVMVNSGATALPFNDQSTAADVLARVRASEIAQSTTAGALAAYQLDVDARFDDVEADVLVQGVALATATSRTASYLTKVAASGADPAYVYMSSDSSAPGGIDSYIAQVAKALLLYNVSGGTLLKVMEAIGGKAHFANPIYIEAAPNRVIVGPAFGASNDLLLWYGPATYSDTTATTANAIFALATSGNFVVSPVLAPPQSVLGFSAEALDNSGSRVLLDSVAVTVPAGATKMALTPGYASGEWTGGGSICVVVLDVVWWNGSTETTLATATVSAINGDPEGVMTEWARLGDVSYTVPAGAGQLRLYADPGGSGDGTFTASTRFNFYSG